MLAVIENIDNDEYKCFMESMYTKYNNLFIKKIKAIYYGNDVEDIISDAFVKIIRHTDILIKMDEPACVTYMVKAMENTAKDYIKKSSKEKQYVRNMENVEEVKESVLNPELTYEKKEFYKNLYKYIEALPERDREIVLYKYLYEFSNKEIARELKIDEKQIHVYVKRARKKLISLMNKEKIDE